jgi:hypothetical protein
MKRVLVALAGVVLLALIGIDVYNRFFRQESPVRAPLPRPSPSAAPTAAPSAVPTTSSAEETPRPAVDAAATPAAKPRTPQRKPVLAGPPSVAALLAQAERGVGARENAPPAELYDQALAIEPRNAQALAGRGRMTAEMTARHSFVAGETMAFQSGDTRAEGRKGALPDVPTGFDAGEVAAKPAPKVPADIEFEVVPARVKPGEPYAVKIYLRNRGRKAIKIREMRIASSSNGARSESTVTPKMIEVPPELIALLTEVPSIWKDGVTGWSMEVAVRSNHGDVYKNNVTWR